MYYMLINKTENGYANVHHYNVSYMKAVFGHLPLLNSNIKGSLFVINAEKVFFSEPS